MLTQSEIDALLTGAIEIEDHNAQGSVNLAEIIGGQPATAAPVKSAEVKGPKAQVYNFWSPDRFTKEQARAVELVHEDLAERLTTSLPTFLRNNIRPRLVHSEQGRFSDFLKDFPPNTLFHMISLAPLPGQIILTLSPNLSSMVLEQRLGGRIEGKANERTLTDIDQSLLRGLVEHMLNDFKAAWSKVAAIEPTLEDSTVNQHWAQMLMGNEKIMLLTFEMSIQGTTGTMNIYIPFSTLKPIANELNPHVWITGRKEKQLDPVQRQKIYETVKGVQLHARVVLGNARLTMREVLELAPGDVIQLETGIRDNLKLIIAEKTNFNAQAGRSGNRLAVQVISVSRDD